MYERCVYSLLPDHRDDTATDGCESSDRRMKLVRSFARSVVFILTRYYPRGRYDRL